MFTVLENIQSAKSSLFTCRENLNKDLARLVDKNGITDEQMKLVCQVYTDLRDAFRSTVSAENALQLLIKLPTE